MGQSIGKGLVIGLVIAVLVYAVMVLAGDTSALLGVLTEFDPVIFIAALGLSVVNYGIRFYKWHYLLKTIGVRIPLRTSVLVFVAGMSMSITPGKFGEILKSGLLKKSDGVPVAESAPVVFAERLTDVLGLVVLAGFGAVAFDYGQGVLVIVVAVIGAALVVLHRPATVSKLTQKLRETRWGERVAEPVDTSYASAKALMGLKSLSWTTLLSVVSWAMEALAFYLICVELGGELSLFLAVFIFSITTILGAVSFLPGGLGVTEGSMLGALELFGVFGASGQATAATGLIRFSTLWFGVVLGWIALAFVSAMLRRRIVDQTQR